VVAGVELLAAAMEARYVWLKPVLFVGLGGDDRPPGGYRLGGADRLRRLRGDRTLRAVLVGMLREPAAKADESARGRGVGDDVAGEKPGASPARSIPLRSQAAPITAVRVPLSRKGNDVEVKGFPLPITGGLLLIGLGPLDGPLEIPCSMGRRRGPESVRELAEEPRHHPRLLGQETTPASSSLEPDIPRTYPPVWHATPGWRQRIGASLSTRR
jgi:hypothetical protein